MKVFLKINMLCHGCGGFMLCNYSKMSTNCAHTHTHNRVNKNLVTKQKITSSIFWLGWRWWDTTASISHCTCIARYWKAFSLFTSNEFQMTNRQMLCDVLCVGPHTKRWPNSSWRFQFDGQFSHYDNCNEVRKCYDFICTFCLKHGRTTNKNCRKWALVVLYALDALVQRWDLHYEWSLNLYYDCIWRA